MAGEAVTGSGPDAGNDGEEAPAKAKTGGSGSSGSRAPVRRKAVLLGIDYTVRDGRTYARLEVKGRRGAVLFHRYDPYFYVDAPPSAMGEIEKTAGKAKDGEIVSPKRVEEAVGELYGEKKKLLKVYCNAPRDVPVLSEAVGYPCFEYSIPFGKRVLMDFGLVPLSVIKYERRGKYISKFLGAGGPAPRRLESLAFDIETYNPHGASRPSKDPAIMLSYSDGKESRVLSWKEVPGKDFVEVVGGEKELIEKFCTILKEKGVDILLAYNSTNYDLPYLRERAKKHKTELSLGRDGGGYRITKKGLIQPLKVRGRVHVDLYPSVRFFGFTGMIKSGDYTLKNVYSAITGKRKMMVERHDIWKMWDNGGAELEELADYSLMDATATYEIGEHILPIQMELGEIARMPLFDVAYTTSGQLVESLLMSEAVSRGMIVPPKPSGAAVNARMKNPIQGAHVKLPEPGIYENIAVFDFRGLYPSIICSYNIDPDRIDREGESYESPTGARFLKAPAGLIPSVLEGLIDRRARIKEKLKKLEKGSTEYKKLDARSYAFKILANSFYGYLVYGRSRWYNRKCGESVTAWGREHILNVEKAAQEAGFKVCYMDSITRERLVPVINPRGHIEVRNVEELFRDNLAGMEKAGGKERILLRGYKTLSVNPKTGKPVWDELTHIIRHKTNKRIYRVNQKWGETRVTEDHSLIVEEGGAYLETPPLELGGRNLATVGRVPSGNAVDRIDLYEVLRGYAHQSTYKGRTKIATVKKNDDFCWFSWTERKEPVLLKRFITTGSPEFKSLCRLLGAYIAEGSASTLETCPRNGASIASSDIKWLEQLRRDYLRLFKNARASIIRSMKGARTLRYKNRGREKCVEYVDGTHKLQMMNGISAVFFKMLCGQKSGGKKLPGFIFNVGREYKLLLLEHMLAGDGSRREGDARYSMEYKRNNFTYTTKSLALASGLSFLLRQMEQKHTINYAPSKSAYTIISSSKHNRRLHSRITREEYDGYVYDLSVKNSHMFVDCCGQVLLHNTDSVFLLLGDKGKKEALGFLERVNSSLPGKMELELEDFYTRGVFVSKKHQKEDTGAKKKYAMLSEDGSIKIRGFELVRRDWSAVARDTQRAVLEAILKEGSKEKAMRIVQETIERLRSGNVPLEEVAIYTQLKKNPRNYDIMSPELSAARKGIERGKKIGGGSIIGYVITRGGKSISEKAELLEFADNYDAQYYVDKQVLPSVMKILKELGYDEYELKHGGKQKGLGDWF